MCSRSLFNSTLLDAVVLLMTMLMLMLMPLLMLVLVLMRMSHTTTMPVLPCKNEDTNATIAPTITITTTPNFFLLLMPNWRMSPCAARPAVRGPAPQRAAHPAAERRVGFGSSMAVPGCLRGRRANTLHHRSDSRHLLHHWACVAETASS